MYAASEEIARLEKEQKEKDIEAEKLRKKLIMDEGRQYRLLTKKMIVVLEDRAPNSRFDQFFVGEFIKKIKNNNAM